MRFQREDFDRRTEGQAESSEGQQERRSLTMKIVKDRAGDRFITPSWKAKEKLQAEEKPHAVVKK